MQLKQSSKLASLSANLIKWSEKKGKLGSSTAHRQEAQPHGHCAVGGSKDSGGGRGKVLNKFNVFFEVKVVAFMLGGFSISKPTPDKYQVKYTHYIFHFGIWSSRKLKQVMILIT